MGRHVKSPDLSSFASVKADRHQEDINQSHKAIDDHQTDSKETQTPILSLEDVTYSQDHIIARSRKSIIYKAEAVDFHDSSSSPEDPNRRYVIKICQPKAKNSDDSILSGGGGDCETELSLLRSLSHPHIAQIRAVSRGSSQARRSTFFYIIDRFDWTLSTQIPKWKEDFSEKSGMGHRGSMALRKSLTSSLRSRSISDAEQDALCQRLQAAFEIASALKYLHERNIVHRNLTPHHICFQRRKVVLIGFDLAEDISSHIQTGPESSYNEDEVYELRGNIGPTKYMAPEVRRCLKYNLKADVYSFSIILFEIMSMERAFQNTSSDMFANTVVYGNSRPRIKKSWPKGVRYLLEECWDAKSSNRPNAYKMREMLRDEIRTLHGSPPPKLSDSRHRTRTCADQDLLLREEDVSLPYLM